MFWKTFRWSFIITIAALCVAFAYGGWKALILCLILGILEISLSFDNAIINSKVLMKMSAFWQKMFLTVGIVIAVFGMRVAFPLLIVGVTAKLNPAEAVTLAMQKGDPEVAGTYGFLLHAAHPQIAAFGGMFLMMLFLDFIFESREITWLTWLERPLARIGQLDSMSMLVSLVALILAAEFVAEDPAVVLLSGVLGIITYLAVNGLGSLFEGGDDDGDDSNDEEQPGIAGSPAQIAAALEKSGGPTGLAMTVAKGGIFSFLYLEVLDASFSFDGVIGAFAITSDPIIIALGLGLIGAMFVRSLTVYFVRMNTLKEFVYLEHGAHWAIGALAVILLVTIGFEVNEVVTGLVGVVLIVAAFWSSLRAKKKSGMLTDNAVPVSTIEGV